MKLFIAGHSDSGDSYLPDGVLPWAERLRRWIEAETGTPCELSGVRFAPAGAKAVEYLMGAVKAAQPDILVLPFGTYVFTVGTVEESVRRRFGERARRLYLRAERRFQSSTSGSPRREGANRAGRRLARTVLGTRTMTTMDQAGNIYEAILHRLAQVEALQVVAVADARFSAETQRRNPGLHEKIERLHARLFPIVEQHHFLLADLEGALRRAPDRSVFHHPDGVHTTATFHGVYFGVMREALTPLLPRLVNRA